MARKLVYSVEFEQAKALAQAKQMAGTFKRELQDVAIKIDTKAATAAAKQAAAGVQQAEKQITQMTAAEARARLGITEQEEQARSASIRETVARAVAAEDAITANYAAEAQKRAQAAKRAADEAAKAEKRKKSLSGQIAGGIAGAITVGALGQFLVAAADLVKLRTESLRAAKGFEILSGGAKVAESRIRAVQTASAGTISRLDATRIATQAVSLNLAKTSEEFGRLTEAARVTSLISPVIHDVSSAISELGLAASNLSFRRLDQLGLSVTEVKQGMAELQAANAGMSDSEAFLKASVDALINKGGAILKTAEAGESGMEKLTVAVANLKAELATGWVGTAFDNSFEQISQLLNSSGVAAGNRDFQSQMMAAQELMRNLKNQGNFLNSLGDATGANKAADLLGLPKPGDSYKEEAGQVQLLISALETVNAEENQLLPGIEGYKEAVAEIVQMAAARGEISEEEVKTLQTTIGLVRELISMGISVDTSAADAAAAAQAAEESRLLAITELVAGYEDEAAAVYAYAKALSEVEGITPQDLSAKVEQKIKFVDAGDSLASGAIGNADRLVENFGLEQAKQIIESQLAQITQVIAEWEGAGVNGLDLQLNIANLEAQMAAQVDAIIEQKERLQEAANFDAVAEQLNSSLQLINSGSFDGVEGLAAMRDELLGLAQDVGFTGGVSDEVAAKIAYLDAVIFSATDSASAYGQTQAALGVEFLTTNDYVGSLATEMAILDGSLATGAISADYHRAALLTLVNAIYAAAVAAGAAAPALANLLSLKNALNAAGPVNTPEGQRGALAASAVERREALRASVARREQLRDRQEQAAKDAAKAQEKAAKETAKGFKDAAKSAAKDFNSAAKSARSAFENVAKSLESALRNVEGLFGTSKVTQEDLDLAEAGGAVNKADDWLRRLRDEVENGKDWADVSIDQAKEALSRIGVETGDSAKEILARFEQAWSDSSLFASKENLAFINQDAVRQQLQIQDKIKEGQKNILELFGATVDGVMAGVKAGDPMLTGLVASELEGSDDKQAQEWAKGLREGKQSVIDKVLEMAQAELQELTGGGGGASAGGGADSPLGIDYSIPERDIFDPLEMGAQQAGDSLGLFGTEVEGWLDAAWASRVPGAPKPDAFGPMPNPTGDIYGALGPLLGALKPGTAGAMAGPALTFDPATATDYANDLIAALQSPANVALLEAAGAPMGTSVAQGLQNATFTEHTAAYFAKLSEAFNTPEGAGHAQRVGKDVGAVIAFGMKDAAFASQVASYLGKLKTAFSMNDVLEPQKAIGKDIGGRIALAMGDAAMTTQAIAYLEKVSSALSAQPTTSLGKTLGGQIASGLDDGDYTTQAKAYITALDTTFDVVDKAYIGKTIGIQIAGGLNDADYTEQAKAYITALDTTFDVVDKAYVGKTIGGQIAAGLDDADLTENVASYITALAGQFETADISPISSVLSGRLTASMQAGPTEVEGDDGKVRRIIDPASGAGAAKAIDDAFLAYQHADLAGDFRTDLSAQFTVITPNLEALGYNAATFIDFGFQDYDFGPSVDGMIGNLSAAFKKDDSIAQLKGLGSFVGEAIFSGFRDSLSGQRWLDALRDELVSAASTQIATGLADQMNATVTTGTGGGRP